MTYDERLAERVRRALEKREDVVEKQMFGGVAFMIRGHMCCGIVRGSLMVRVDPVLADRWLREAHVRPMDFTGRPMRGFLFVDAAGLVSAPALRKWIARATEFVETKPVKATGSPRRAAERRARR